MIAAGDSALNLWWTACRL